MENEEEDVDNVFSKNGIKSHLFRDKNNISKKNSTVLNKNFESESNSFFQNKINSILNDDLSISSKKGFTDSEDFQRKNKLERHYDNNSKFMCQLKAFSDDENSAKSNISEYKSSTIKDNEDKDDISEHNSLKNLENGKIFTFGNKSNLTSDDENDFDLLKNNNDFINNCNCQNKNKLVQIKNNILDLDKKLASSKNEQIFDNLTKHNSKLIINDFKLTKDKYTSKNDDEKEIYSTSMMKNKEELSSVQEFLTFKKNKLINSIDLKSNKKNDDSKSINKIVIGSSSDEEDSNDSYHKENEMNFPISPTATIQDFDNFNHFEIHDLKNSITENETLPYVKTNNVDFENNNRLKNKKEIVIDYSDFTSQTTQESQKDDNKENTEFYKSEQYDLEDNYTFPKEPIPTFNENQVFSDFEEELCEIEFNSDYKLKEPYVFEKGNQTDSSLKESEERFLKKLQKAREVYQQMVEDALNELDPAVRKNYDISEPPVFESMSNEQMEKELEQYGFRFTNRASAISKLNRCWAAKNKIETHSQKETSPIEFIRKKSKYYEQILIYQPIPLGALFREMNEYGIKISVNQLRMILDEEGVAFLDDNHSLFKKMN